MQNRMVDLGAGAYPVFCDINEDGLTDIIAGNYGYYDTSYLDEYLILHTEQTSKLGYFKNTGSTEMPAFNFITRDLAGVSDLNLTGIVPSFADLDGDGDTDMLLGAESGKLILFENVNNSEDPPQYELIQDDYQGIDVGEYSSPCLFDLDKDNLTDLVIGEKAGNLNYYKNTGTEINPVFTLVTDSLGKINVTDPDISLYGYSVPVFYRDNTGTTHLLVGSEQGVIHYFTGIDGNLEGAFSQSDELSALIGLPEIKQDMGYRTAPAIFDLDQDGHPELICGNFSGGMEYFGINSTTPVSHIEDNETTCHSDIFIYPVPAKDELSIAFPLSETRITFRYQVFNIMGKQVAEGIKSLENKTSIDVSALPGGIYFLRISFYDSHLNINMVRSSKVILM
jgi:hypothetical protein